MKTRIFLLFATTLALSLLSANTFSAPVKPVPPPKKPHVSTQITISNVGSDSITVKAPKGEQTYKIDGKTSIRVDGKAGKVEDLKPGMVVEVGASSIPPNLAYSIAAKTPGK